MAIAFARGGRSKKLFVFTLRQGSRSRETRRTRPEDMQAIDGLAAGHNVHAFNPSTVRLDAGEHVAKLLPVHGDLRRSGVADAGQGGLVWFHCWVELRVTGCHGSVVGSAASRICLKKLLTDSWSGVFGFPASSGCLLSGITHGAQAPAFGEAF